MLGNSDEIDEIRFLKLVCVCFWGNILSEHSSPGRLELWLNIDEKAGRAAHDQQLLDQSSGREMSEICGVRRDRRP